MSKKFRVEDKETIADCLDRMKKEGFMPIRRIEKPVYKENKRWQYRDFKTGYYICRCFNPINMINYRMLKPRTLTIVLGILCIDY